MDVYSMGTSILSGEIFKYNGTLQSIWVSHPTKKGTGVWKEHGYGNFLVVDAAENPPLHPHSHGILISIAL
jgi:hypothetical protein